MKPCTKKQNEFFPETVLRALIKNALACLKPGCRCDPGYVRQTTGYDDACVKIESCKPPPPTTTTTTKKTTSHPTKKTTHATPRTTSETTSEPTPPETKPNPSTSESPTLSSKAPVTTTLSTPWTTTNKPPTDKDCQKRYGPHSHLVPCPMSKTCEQPDGPEIHGHLNVESTGKVRVSFSFRKFVPSPQPYARMGHVGPGPWPSSHF